MLLTLGNKFLLSLMMKLLLGVDPYTVVGINSRFF